MSTLAFPEPDARTLSRREEIINGLHGILGAQGVIESEDERRVYETDALTAYRTRSWPTSRRMA